MEASRPRPGQETVPRVQAGPSGGGRRVWQPAYHASPHRAGGLPADTATAAIHIDIQTLTGRMGWPILDEEVANSRRTASDARPFYSPNDGDDPSDSSRPRRDRDAPRPVRDRDLPENGEHTAPDRDIAELSARANVRGRATTSAEVSRPPSLFGSGITYSGRMKRNGYLSTSGVSRCRNP